MERFYPVGTPGQPWTGDDRKAWFARQTVQRSYADEVRGGIARLDDAAFTVSTYGALSIDPVRYPLLSVTMSRAGADAPWALITGGVHGYETSGVQGALSFLHDAATDYIDRFNLLVLPCVSPWGYEVINRWNPQAIDPNRSFRADSPAEESAAVVELVRRTAVGFLVHVDLHETTDSDENEFRPALAARDGKAFEPGMIPDGFYTVGDAENPQPAFQAAIVAAVAEVTHIAEADEQGRIIGSAVEQHGVIHYPFKPLGLCAGVTDARFATTTEVYPDSPRITDAVCNAAQVATVRAALDFALRDRVDS
jgi:hypothetical protein